MGIILIAGLYGAGIEVAHKMSCLFINFTQLLFLSGNPADEPKEMMDLRCRVTVRFIFLISWHLLQSWLRHFDIVKDAIEMQAFLSLNSGANAGLVI